MPDETDTIVALSPYELARLPLFRGVHLHEVESEIKSCPCLRVSTDSVVIAPGQSNQRLYVILRGSMSVHLRSPEDDPIAILSRGDVFGELSVIDFAPTSAYVLAHSSSRLLAIDREALRSMFRASPDIATNLMALLAQKLRGTNRQLVRDGDQDETLALTECA